MDANPPAPHGPEITLVKQGDLPDDEVDFCTLDGPRTVVTGSGLALGAEDTVKLELRPGKGEVEATLDQLEDLRSSDSELSFLNHVNSSGHPDGDWWGQDVLLTVTAGGAEATRWVKFAEHS